MDGSAKWVFHVPERQPPESVPVLCTAMYVTQPE